MPYQQITRKELDDLANQCVVLQERLMRAGLYKTAQVAHNTTRAVGYEMAEIISGKHPTTLKTDES